MAAVPDSQSFRWLHASDITAYGHHYGGALLHWAEEEAGLYAARQLGTFRIGTVAIDGVRFPEPLARAEELLELRISGTKFGRSSLRFRLEIDGAAAGVRALEIESMVFARLAGTDERPEAGSRLHGFSSVVSGAERLRESSAS